MSTHRLLAGLALVPTILNFIVWLISWILWTFVLESVDFEGPLYWVARVCGPLQAICISAALVLLCIAAMMSPGRTENRPAAA
ncbi:MAG: hypothetical protein JSV91_05700 [Phycisphaerales bacterium]|nr:MAG: hypothetical protein JSV91_05700 [Phycisphaerales bacterium]